MYYNIEHPGSTGAFVLTASLTAWLLGFLLPELAWPIAATVLVLASILILRVGIHAFLAVCAITIAHFVTLVPPPYGRGELPFDYLLGFVILPFTLAAGSIAIWYWRERTRK